MEDTVNPIPAKKSKKEKYQEAKEIILKTLSNIKRAQVKHFAVMGGKSQNFFQKGGIGARALESLVSNGKVIREASAEGKWKYYTLAAPSAIIIPAYHQPEEPNGVADDNEDPDSLYYRLGKSLYRRERSKAQKEYAMYVIGLEQKIKELEAEIEHLKTMPQQGSIFSDENS